MLKVNRKEMSELQRTFVIENLEIRRKRTLLRLMYNQSLSDENLQEVIEYMVLRSSKKVKIKSDFTKLTKVQRSPFYRGLKLWNKLPVDVQKEVNRVKFKERVKKCIK